MSTEHSHYLFQQERHRAINKWNMTGKQPKLGMAEEDKPKLWKEKKNDNAQNDLLLQRLGNVKLLPAKWTEWQKIKRVKRKTNKEFEDKKTV